MKTHTTLGIWLLLLTTAPCIVTVHAQAQGQAPNNATIIERSITLSHAGKFADAQQALEARLAVEKRNTEKIKLQNALADVHCHWADYLETVYDFEGAISHYQKAYATDKTLRRLAAAADLNNIGSAYRKLSQHEKALLLLNQALPIFRQGKDRSGEATTLNNIGWVYVSMSQYEKALVFFNQALPIFREVKDRKGEATTLDNIGWGYDSLNQSEKALVFFNQALAIFREVKDRKSEANTLDNIGLAYWSLGQQEKALVFYNQALSIQRQVKDRPGEAVTLTSIAGVYSSLAQQEQALVFYNQALPIFREVKDRKGEADTLNWIGFAYWRFSQNEQAIVFYNQALPLYRELKNRDREANILTGIGIAYQNLSQYEQALVFYNQALPIFRELKNRDGEANILTGIGIAYQNLSQYEQALVFYNQALPIQRELKNRNGEANIFNSIGLAYGSLGQNEQALALFNQSLPIYRELKSRHGEALSLCNIGVAYKNLGQNEQALVFLNQALFLFRTVKDRRYEANTLNNIGLAYWSLSQYEQALVFYNQALPLFRQIKDRSGEANTLYNLMLVSKGQKHPEIAIVWGKQAVNVKQSIRRDIAGLSKESKDAYLQGNKNTYETLARLLIDAGRFAEADEVLSMVQQNEFLEFVRRDSRGIRMEEKYADFVGLEKLVVAEQDQKVESVMLLANEEFTLSGLDKPSLVQTARLVEVRRQLKEVTEQLDRFFAAMPARFARETGDVQTDRNRLSAIQPVLNEMGGHVAVVSTFVDEKGLELLLTLPTGPTLHLSFSASDIKTGDKSFPQWLNTQVHDFIAAIAARAPVEDRATQLNNIVSCHGALHQQLEGTGITTLLWRLNGPLRSMPLAALRDKDGYWVEKYQNVVLTAGSSDLNLSHRPVNNWKALGVGVTNNWTVGGDLFPALSGVRGELQAVVNAPDDGFQGGVLPGHVMEDANFTETSFFRSLRPSAPGAPSPWQVIHIASHFKVAGDSLKSFLLLGDGQPLTVAALQERARLNPLFPGVELMTLSACQTAQGTDSLGALAEVNGAKAVLATLWPVADKETALLMANFYQTHAKNGDRGKAWALQQAQLALLHGTATSSHPYFWAPFVLMGNPR